MNVAYDKIDLTQIFWKFDENFIWRIFRKIKKDFRTFLRKFIERMKCINFRTDDASAHAMNLSDFFQIVTSSYTDLQDYTYYFVPAPWLSVKLVRLLQYYPPPGERRSIIVSRSF